MRIPNADLAIVDIEKLAGYCLSPEHPRGRHKARVFAAALGFTVEHAEQLRLALLSAIQSADANLIAADEYGGRYVLDSFIHGPEGEAWVRSSWIIRSGEGLPRLTSCYVR